MDNALHFPKINELTNDVLPVFAPEILGDIEDLPMTVDEMLVINIKRLNGTYTQMTVENLRTFALSLLQEFQMNRLDPRLLDQEVYVHGYFNIGTGNVEPFVANEPQDVKVGSFGGIIKLTADKQLNLL